jgi:peptidoglycan hydrolase-like protein with peptidoglycan-binding domain
MRTRAVAGRRGVALAAGAALVAVVALGACGSSRSTSSPPAAGVAAASADRTVSGTTIPTVPPGTVVLTTPPTPTTTTTLPAYATQSTALGVGDQSAAVAALQRRLLQLGYWVDTTDGYFDDSTQQAVYAFQKAANLTRDGEVGAVTGAALVKGARPVPRPAAGYLIEVDLADDLVMFVDDGHLEWILNTSTGGGYTYTSDGVTSVAITPEGVFHTYREVDGTVTDSLGTLWRPKYFYSGFAIHGDSYVPSVPVSHGCVRISNEAIDWVWAANLDPIGTEVWIYS